MKGHIAPHHHNSVSSDDRFVKTGRVHALLMYFLHTTNFRTNPVNIKQYLLFMCITPSAFIQPEEVTEFIATEVTFYVLLLIDNARAQSFLVCLTLEYLLLNTTGLEMNEVTRVVLKPLSSIQ